MSTTHSDYWQRPLAYLKGVGPSRAQLLAEEVKLYTYQDLINYYPRKYVDRSRITKIKDLISGSDSPVSLVGTLGQFETADNLHGGKRLTCTLRDGTGWVELNWFQGANYIQKKFIPGEEVALFGKPSWFQGRARFNHPEMEPLRDDTSTQLHQLGIIPFYAGTDKLKKAGLDSRGFRRLIHRLISESQHAITETLPEYICRQQQLIPLSVALIQIHFPDSLENLERAQYRLKFEELLYFELIMARRKQVYRLQKQSPPFLVIGNYFNTFYKAHLPFELTNAQKRVIKEIRADVYKTTQMNRLIQGDVGSGKTIVAMMTMLIAADNGFQAAMMAPTEILAEQHFQNITKFVTPLGLKTQLLTGSIRKSEKKMILEQLAGGEIHFVIGTHALIEEAVQFKNLGLTIIDEQHKFGVLQRSALWSKAPHGLVPHNLAMTATPIPRTLAMTTYGDIDISIINELPKGRKPIETWLKTEAQRLEAFGFMKKALAQGRQVYVVYPLVEESSKTDLLAVTQGFEAISRTFSEYRVGMVHGKMKSEIKEAEMAAFKTGQTHILVATTVIEVGVDVPNATVMLIENAERFGLSQLHQLRGRVGRGAEQSYCILMASNKISADARQRLEAMTQTNDGFRISEIDLALRGPGDFLGTRQSGIPEFSLADIVADEEIVAAARKCAFDIITADPKLSNPEHQSIQQALINFNNKHQLQEIMA